MKILLLIIYTIAMLLHYEAISYKTDKKEAILLVRLVTLVLTIVSAYYLLSKQ